jgi:hypothetical protein
LGASVISYQQSHYLICIFSLGYYFYLGVINRLWELLWGLEEVAFVFITRYGDEKNGHFCQFRVGF